MNDVRTELIDLEDDRPGWTALDYRPIWKGDTLVGFEVFYYPNEEN